MTLLDVTQTSHTRARSGIQRVVRSLAAAFGDAARPVCYDPYAARWRSLNRSEAANLAARDGISHRRSAQWPWTTRLAGRLARARKPARAPWAETAGLVVPEVFSEETAGPLRTLLAQVHGPRVAVFHDAFPLRFPEQSAPGTVARFPRYLRDLLAFDGIIAVSRASRADLLEYWAWQGAVSPPPVLVLSPAIEAPPTIPIATATGNPVVLSVGTLEPRKNHLSLLDACEQLWRSGSAFRLRLIGLAPANYSEPVVARIRELQRAGRDLHYDGPVDEPALERAYAEAAFTVYPSWAEGFGLPVAESLVRGRPCLCARNGALGEIADAGGCLTVERPDRNALAGAMRTLLADRAAYETLAAAARQRTFRSWNQYVEELTAWMRTLRQA